MMAIPPAAAAAAAASTTTRGARSFRFASLLARSFGCAPSVFASGGRIGDPEYNRGATAAPWSSIPQQQQQRQDSALSSLTLGTSGRQYQTRTDTLSSLDIKRTNLSCRYFSDGGATKKEEEGDKKEDVAAKTEEEEQADVPDLSRFTQEVEVKMPDMGDGDGKILKWFKKEGDVVNHGDILCDIETPDFTYGMETDEEATAVMGRILIDAPSDPIKDDEVICVLLHEALEEEEKEKRDGDGSAD